jgi:hypothetical protein
MVLCSYELGSTPTLSIRGKPVELHPLNEMQTFL